MLSSRRRFFREGEKKNLLEQTQVHTRSEYEREREETSSLPSWKGGSLGTKNAERISGRGLDAGEGKEEYFHSQKPRTRPTWLKWKRSPYPRFEIKEKKKKDPELTGATLFYCFSQRRARGTQKT